MMYLYLCIYILKMYVFIDIQSLLCIFDKSSYFLYSILILPFSLSILFLLPFLCSIKYDVLFMNLVM